jgi:hypothetical protein
MSHTAAAKSFTELRTLITADTGIPEQERGVQTEHRRAATKQKISRKIKRAGNRQPLFRESELIGVVGIIFDVATIRNKMIIDGEERLVGMIGLDGVGVPLVVSGDLSFAKARYDGRAIRGKFYMYEEFRVDHYESRFGFLVTRQVESPSHVLALRKDTARMPYGMEARKLTNNLYLSLLPLKRVEEKGAVRSAC